MAIFDESKNDWVLMIEGQWVDDGLKITHVNPAGPARKMFNADGTQSNISLRDTDVIALVNDHPILNNDDWRLAVDGAPNHDQIKLTVIFNDTALVSEAVEVKECYIKSMKRESLFPIQTPEAKNSDGDTSATVSAKVSKQLTKGLIELTVKVKKTGSIITGGVGYAYGQAALLDKDANTLFKTDITEKQKGADLSGDVEGEQTDNYDVALPELLATRYVAVMAKAHDTTGLPTSIQDFENTLDNVEHLLKTAAAIAQDVAVIVDLAEAAAA